jgi:hypothetical protein
MSRSLRRMWTVLATTAATAGLMISVTATAQAATNYQFVNVKSIKCMSVAGASTANSARIVIATCDSTATVQDWYQENRDADGYYRYRNGKSDKCLSVAGGGSTAAGAAIIQYTCNGAAEQQWGLDYLDHHYHLENRKSGLAITLVGGATVENTPMVQQSYVGGTDQLWEPN